MRESLELGWSVDRVALLGIHEGFGALFPEKEGLRMGLGMGSAGLATFVLLPASVLLHEEWHRAVLGQYDISSHDDGLDPTAIFRGPVSVSHLADGDLAWLKAEHPADMVRLMSAGIESQVALGERFGDEAFLHGRDSREGGRLFTADSWAVPFLAMNHLQNLIYFAECASPSSDDMTDEMNRAEPTVPPRDFTGLDCNAWVYDMERPDEPYAERGQHPWGPGIDRYRSWSDLTTDEQGYLRLQTGLYLLNALDPHLVGIDGFNLPNGGRMVGNVRHLIGPWGYEVDARFGLVKDGLALRAELRNGIAAHGWFPGVGARLDDLPLRGPLTLDLRADAWLQPEDQRHDAAKRVPGGLVAADLGWRVFPRLDLDFGLTAKTAGFVMGEVDLGPSLGGRIGVVGHIK
jgi:hypothetical protein